MAAFAACNLVGKFGVISHCCFSRLAASGSLPRSGVRLSYYSGPVLRCRQISQLVNRKRLLLVDTLALVRRLEEEGIPTKQAEVITSAITDVSHDSMQNVSCYFVSREEMQKVEMAQESNMSKFKSEVQNSQGHHFSSLQHETEKLRGDMDKLRSELRYEIDKITAGQRLDLNHERGQIREDLASQTAETTNLTNKLDREIHALRSWKQQSTI